MEIYTYIQNDHIVIRKMLHEISAMPDYDHERRLCVFGALRDFATLHNDTEEATFYVALEQHASTRAQAWNGEKEHREVADFMQSLSSPKALPAVWRENFAEFRQALLLHIHEEETKVFAMARKIIPLLLSHELTIQMGLLKGVRQEILAAAPRLKKNVSRTQQWAT